MPYMDHQNHESALKVNEGIEQPEQVSPSAVERFKSKKQQLLKPDEYVQGILSGNRTILSKAITLVESVNPLHYALAQDVIEKMPATFRKFGSRWNYRRSWCREKYFYRSPRKTPDRFWV